MFQIPDSSLLYYLVWKVKLLAKDTHVSQWTRSKHTKFQYANTVKRRAASCTLLRFEVTRYPLQTRESFCRGKSLSVSTFWLLPLPFLPACLAHALQRSVQIITKLNKKMYLRPLVSWLNRNHSCNLEWLPHLRLINTHQSQKYCYVFLFCFMLYLWVYLRIVIVILTRVVILRWTITCWT